MKQLIFIIVIITICISINADVLSKAKFGNWDTRNYLPGIIKAGI